MTGGARWRKVGRLAMLLGACTAVLVPLGAGALDPLRAAAADIYVAVVIDFGGGPGAPGDVVKCVSVPTGSTDAQALSIADNHTTAYASSGLLCGIDTYPPNAVANCKAASGSGYYFWSYWHGTGGSWVYANDGPAEQVVSPGEVEGWRFQDPGPASPSAPAPATAPDFSSICADGTTSSTSTGTAGGSSGSSATPVATTNPTATTQPPTVSSTAPRATGASSPSAGHGVAGTAPSSAATQPGPAGTTTAPQTPAHSSTNDGAAGATTTTAAPQGGAEKARSLGRVVGPHGSGGSVPWPLVVTGAVVLGLGIASLLRWRRRRDAL